MAGDTAPTAVEFLDELVRLAMQAIDRTAADVGMDGGPPLYRVALERHLRERMAQAATVYGLEARGPVPLRNGDIAVLGLYLRCLEAERYCTAQADEARREDDHRTGAWWDGRAADLRRWIAEVDREVVVVQLARGART